jgi:basic amino acid/polyamine antiporter, APA family
VAAQIHDRRRNAELVYGLSVAATGTLPRHLGLADAVVIGVGSMVGAGVFTAWSPAAEAAGGALLIGLLVAAVVAFCNATSSAQLAALHPESGGTYVYARHHLGDGWGHLAGWGFVVGKTASCAAMALAIGAYVWPAHDRWVAVAAVVVVTAVNVGGLERTARVTRVVLACSLAALTIVVVAGWRTPGASLRWVDPRGADVYHVFQAAGLLFFAFAGYARIATLGEEVREPAVTIPKAVTRALAGALTIYLVVGLTTVAAVPVGVLAATDAPLRVLIERSPLDALAPVVGAGATVAAFGVLLNLVPGVSRTALAMARRRDLPGALARVDGRRSVPLRAELTVLVAVIVLVVVIELRSAIAVSSVAVLTYYAVTNAAAYTLGRGERRWPPAVAALGLVGCVALVAALPGRALAGGLVVLATGAVARAVGTNVSGRRVHEGAS